MRRSTPEVEPIRDFRDTELHMGQKIVNMQTDHSMVDLRERYLRGMKVLSLRLKMDVHQNSQLISIMSISKLSTQFTILIQLTEPIHSLQILNLSSKTGQVLSCTNPVRPVINPGCQDPSPENQNLKALKDRNQNHCLHIRERQRCQHGRGRITVVTRRESLGSPWLCYLK